MSYRELRSYQQATIVYDFTVAFCDRYVEGGTNLTNRSNRTYKFYSRMSDQMIQAARSGKQNIVEGSSEKTSEKSELKLLGVARASFQELLEDYEDFLRQRGMKRWEKDDPRSLAVRNLYKSDLSNGTNQSYRSYLSNPETAANAAICLIHQVNFLLDRQIKTAEAQFVRDGGYAENLRKKREEEKKRKLGRWLHQWRND